MNEKLAKILDDGRFTLSADNIYTPPNPPVNSDQSNEQQLREKVASNVYENYLAIIAGNHSMPVMDAEVDRFLEKMPENALILDVGGCWGWHWRRIAQTRSDISIVVIDFIKNNLKHAVNILGQLIDKQVVLVHADATSLPFPDNVFDGVWTVQTFQHIPDFSEAVKNAYRVLKNGGYFINYSLHNTPVNRVVYKLLGKHYHLEGMVKNAFYLERANQKQKVTIANVFNSPVTSRYTECIFHPDLKLTFSGREGSLFGRLDAWLANLSFISRLVARQQSFEVTKNPA